MSNAIERCQATPKAVALLGCAGAAGFAGTRAFASPVARAWIAVSRPAAAPDRLVGSVVVLLCAVVLAVTLLWLAASTVVCLHDLRRDAPFHDRPRTFRPQFVRALLALTLSSLVTVAGPGAQADRRPELPRALDGLPLPDLPYGGVQTHLVRSGESLWSIASNALPRATDTAVSRVWPRLYHLNRGRIGPDPGLIRPGTTLRLPPGIPATTRGATR